MSSRWLGAGLLLATLSTLLLETLDARLLSVLTWYHLSFLAVSLAMLGMAAGAVFVFLHADRFSAERAPGTVARVSWWLACAIPLSHVATLSIPFLPVTNLTVMEVLSVAVSTVVLAVPFALSGVVVTAALTRCGGSIGKLYALDLIGAALGCVLVIPLLDRSNVSGAILLSGAAAALANWCFVRHARETGAAKGRGQRRALLLAATLATVALLNTGPHPWLEVLYPKNQALWLTNKDIRVARWNSHSYVLVHGAGEQPPFLWGPGKGGDAFRTRLAWMVIDGDAATPITEWDGHAESLDWVSYDVTTLPYFLRHGRVAVIGVGGGRDILAALWGRNQSIVGIDVNEIMIDLLTGSHRDFAKIADQPQVELVHDDARSHLTRTDRRFDIIQMSLVDTWASTGAGAFSLSENGLYTLDAWRVFLNRLEPGGILSVSRWFDPTNVSETSRLLSLGVAALIDRHVANPRDHLLLLSRERVATLMISPSPFSDADRAALTGVASSREFTVLASPWDPNPTGLVDRIARSRTMTDLRSAIADPFFDYSPPTDARPYYFNMLKPRALWGVTVLPRAGTLGGNMRATLTLLVLLAVTTLLVALIIVWPLVKAGRPPMRPVLFATTMAYFAAIGFAYMLIQIGLLQRFSIYLGHPTYTLAIVLFSMLLFTGLGSVLSTRVIVPWAMRLVPIAIAGMLVFTALALPGVIARTIGDGLPARTAIVLAFAAPLSTCLGMCFPFGVRLTEESPAVVPWGWGVNGAFGVLASILAVMLSIWISIDVNFWIAGALYLAITVPMGVMRRARGSRLGARGSRLGARGSGLGARGARHEAPGGAEAPGSAQRKRPATP